VIWNTRSDPETARIFLRLSALGWVFIGPLALGLLHEITGKSTPRTRRTSSYLYRVSSGFLLASWFTPWMHSGVVPTRWGWGYEIGWLHPFYLVFTVACIVVGLADGLRAYRSASPGEKAQALSVGGGIVLPLCLASATDGLLPLAGFQPPHLGTAAMTLFGVSIAWGFYRYGYSLLAPGAFSNEILETFPIGVAMLRIDGRIRSANGAMARLLGTPPDALVGVQVRDLLFGHELNLIEEVTEVECQMRSFGDGRIPVSISSTILCDRQQAPIGLVLAVRDLREVVALRSRLVVSDRLAAVGEMAAGIAHEINNPLEGMSNYLTLARDALGREDTEAAERHVSSVRQGLERAAGIVRQVLAHADPAKAPKTPVDLNDVLRETEHFVESRRDFRHVRFELDLADGPLLVRGSPVMLGQVAVNLILNACEVQPEGGEVRVTSRREDGQAVVDFADRGPGIAEADRPRVFEPFFSTRESTGLGLSICHTIVKQHEGELTVHAREGGGSLFRMKLPALADAATAAPDGEGTEARVP
jgi:PAS domain S-box-containing protein